jgi:hypothetical protein
MVRLQQDFAVAPRVAPSGNPSEARVGAIRDRGRSRSQRRDRGQLGSMQNCKTSGCRRWSSTSPFRVQRTTHNRRKTIESTARHSHAIADK